MEQEACVWVNERDCEGRLRYAESALARGTAHQHLPNCRLGSAAVAPPYRIPRQLQKMMSLHFRYGDASQKRRPQQRSSSWCAGCCRPYAQESAMHLQLLRGTYGSSLLPNSYSQQRKATDCWRGPSRFDSRRQRYCYVAGQQQRTDRTEFGKPKLLPNHHE